MGQMTESSDYVFPFRLTLQNLKHSIAERFLFKSGWSNDVSWKSTVIDEYSLRHPIFNTEHINVPYHPYSNTDNYNYDYELLVENEGYYDNIDETCAYLPDGTPLPRHWGKLKHHIFPFSIWDLNTHTQIE